MSVGSMAGNAKKRNMPPIGLLVAGAVALIALGIYGYKSMAPAQPAVDKAPVAASQAVSVKTSPVTQGAISVALSYAGDVKAASQVSVLPKASGTIDRLGVDVGSKVKKGDVIAELDSASQQTAVAQARANLAAAQARLASLQEGARPEAVAQARAALESASARLDQVKKGPNDAQRQAASSAVEQTTASLSSARANVQAAQAGVDALKAWPTQREWGAALAAVDSAKANVRAAEEKLADVKAGAKPAELLAATQAVEAARAALMAKQDGLQVAKDNGTPLASWAASGTSLGQSQEALVAARTAYEAAKANLALLQSRPLPWELQAAASNVDAANASLNAASAAVEQMKRGATPEDITKAQAQVTSAQNGVTSAEAALATAQASLKQTQDGATEEELRIAQAQVAGAESALALASSPYRTADFEAARAGVAQAQAALDAAELGLGETRVLSPVDGVVADRMQSEGQLVGLSAPIVSIVSSEVELSLGVEEAQIGSIAEGQQAEITVAAYPGQAFPAKVAVIAPTADPKSRTFQVKVRPVTSDGRLRSGMFAQVRIVTAEKGSALVVPREALVTRGGTSSVFVLKGDSVEARAVRTGMVSGGSVEITSGLTAGEEVVTSGQSDLRDGDKVKKS